MFNTIIKYTRTPNEDDFSTHDSECILKCNDPLISYYVPKKTLRVIGPNVDLEVRAINIHIHIYTENP